MISTQTDSRSLLLRATHILQIRILDTVAEDWRPISSRLKERFVNVKVAIEEILKGNLAEKGGDTIPLRLRQADNVGPMLLAVPGSWSAATLTPGEVFLTFSRSPNTEAAAVLSEPACECVQSDATAMNDVRLALRSGIPPLPLPQFVALCQAERNRLGRLIGEYLVARLPEILCADLPGFNTMMNLVEQADLSPVARTVLVTGIYSRALAIDPAPSRFVARLLLGSFRLLTLASASALHTNLTQTYLPNLLGWEGGAEKKLARFVFAEQMDEWRLAESVLAQLPASAQASKLLDWVRSR